MTTDKETPMRDVMEIWLTAKVAAEALATLGLEYPSVQLGAFWPPGDLAELARLAGVPLKRTLFVDQWQGAQPPYVIESVEAVLGGVSVRAQGVRPATEEDAVRGAHFSGPCRTASPEEARKALGVAERREATPPEPPPDPDDLLLYPEHSDLDCLCPLTCRECEANSAAILERREALGVAHE